MPFPAKIKTFLLMACLAAAIQVPAQTARANPYGLPIISTMQQYRDSVRLHPEFELVDLEKAVPGIVPDIRYATKNNFTHAVVYTQPRALLRKPAAEALARVQRALSLQGLGLKVYDAYRPYAATLLFYEIVKDTLFVASPAKGSRHNRGCAADVTLISLETGLELEMPTPFDDFTEKASPTHPGMTPEARKNLNLLVEAMKKEGFTVFASEWWHYDYNGWQQFPLMDLSFEELNGK